MSGEEIKPTVAADRYASLLNEARSLRGVSLGKDAWRRLRRNRVAMISLVILAFVALGAILTPILPLQSPIRQDLKNRQFKQPDFSSVSADLKENLAEYDSELATMQTAYANAASEAEKEKLAAEIESFHEQNPLMNFAHQPGPMTRMMIRARLAIFGDWCLPSIFGTDNLGRDVLARTFWGARVSLVVGIVATFVSLIIGVSYGAISGYFGGWVDDVMMRVVDILYSVPFIFVVIFILTIVSEDSIRAKLEAYHISDMVVFYVIIGAIYWLTMARVVRGQVISLKNEQFVEAARTCGASGMRVVFRHLIPNVMGIVIVYLTLTIPAVMLFEAFLSFLGLGVDAPDVSWGLQANEGMSVITPIKTYWWLVLFPGLALTTTLFALNFLGNGLRDALDPRMKNRA